MLNHLLMMVLGDWPGGVYAEPSVGAGDGVG